MTDKPPLYLEELNTQFEGEKPVNYAYRSRVPGGWLIFLYKGGLTGATFYPDPNHAWDGGTLEA
jgi:hypothetical protein